MRFPCVLTLLFCSTFLFAQERNSSVLQSVAGKGLYHPDAITSIDITPDGSVFATAGTNGEVRIWKTSSGELIKTISIKAKDVHISQVKYLKSGEQLLVNLGSDGIQIYDAKKNYSKLDQESTLKADRVSTSANGELWAMQDGLNKIKLVARSTMQDEMVLPEARTVGISRDGKLVGFIHDKTVEVLEIPSGKPVFKWTSTTEPGHLSFSARTRYLAVCGDGTQSRVQILDLQTKKATDSFEGEGPLHWLGDEKLLYRHRDRVILMRFDKAARSEVVADDVTQFAVSEAGNYLVADSGRRTGSSRLRRWNLELKQEVLDVKNELQGFVSTHFVGSAPALIQKNGVLELSKDGHWLTRFEQGITTTAATGSKLVLGSHKGIQVVDLGQPHGKPVNVPGFEDGVSHVTCDTKAERLASITMGEKPQLVVCDWEGKNRSSEPMDSLVHGIAMSADGSAVFVFSRNGQITKYDAKLKKTWAVRGIRSLNGALALAPDGKTFAVATMVKVTIHDAESGKVTETIERQWDDSPFVSLAYSSDSRMLAMGTRDGSGVLLWDADFRAVVKRFRPTNSTVWDITFDPTARMMSTIGSGDQLTTWDVSGRLKAKPPTSEELEIAWKQFGQVGATPAWEAMWVLNDARGNGLTVVERGIAETKQRFGNIAAYIADLGHPNFQKRSTATNELLSIGRAVVPYLKKAQEDSKSNEEQQARIETLLTQLAYKSEKHEDNKKMDELLRIRRTVVFLRRNGSPEAKKLLEKFPAFDTEINAAVKEALGK